MSTSFDFPVRVYYEDTDFSGNVYHGAYVKFFERGRTEWLRALGVHHHELSAEGLAFAVRRMEIEFLQAAHIDDALTVRTAFSALEGARILLDQSIWLGDTQLAMAEVTIVVINSAGRATRLPVQMRDLFLSK